jgi:predicted ferric reductase
VTNISRAWWLVTGLVAALWIVSEPDVLTVQGFIPIRNLLVQASGILAIVAMSVAMLLALRPRWPERWFGGLDKMYRLHKWLGITALSASIFHWVASNAPKWAVQAGIMERGQRPPRQAADNVIEQALNGLRHPAEFAGEWTFYFAALLMVLALVKWFPYRLFFKTHRLLAAAYLILVFHAAVLTKFAYWTTPVGLLLALALAAGTWAAIIVLLRRIAKERQVDGRIGSTQYYPGVHALEFSVDVPQGWTGHKPGQFAFVTLDEREGPHPFTIASAWDASQPRITFIVKELGDHTQRLRDSLKVGQSAKIEGPYGCFTFEDEAKQQIWIGGGIGITPFVARMKQLAAHKDPTAQSIYLFHPTAEFDEAAMSKLRADAQAAGVHLRISVDARDGLLNAEAIRSTVPNWRDASIWFCGPTGLADVLKRDFATAGFPLERFHQELFAMR